MNKIAKLFSSSNVDALLIYSQKNRYYLTGFNSTAGYLVITKNATSFITDFRYGEMASYLKNDGIDVYVLSGKESFLKIIELLTDVNAKTVGIEDTEITLNVFNAFRERLNGFQLVPCGQAIAKVKQVKTQQEIEYIAKAQEVTDKVFTHMCSFIKCGMTEMDIAVELECQIRKMGGTGLAFDTIIASGKNSSKPHAHPTDKKLEIGDPLTMDFGASYKGYCSDMTRTIFIGEPSKEMLYIYNIVKEAQEATLSVMKAGMRGCDLDKIARDVIDRYGFKDNFQHGLGHSLGLDIHETPNLNAMCEDVFEENMLGTVEPGIYVENLGGVRIEDLVVFTKDGIRNLTKSDKSVIIIE